MSVRRQSSVCMRRSNGLLVSNPAIPWPTPTLAFSSIYFISFLFHWTTIQHSLSRIMARTCVNCDHDRGRNSFSRNQWIKGDGYSRCVYCVAGAYSFQCGICDRTFNTQNEVNMHQQVHRPKQFQCPVCEDRLFRSGANVVQHLESGSCSHCHGRDNARQQIYDFASKQKGIHRFMTEVPMLTYAGYEPNRVVPNFPYMCPDCDKVFRQLSQLLQHLDQKHGINKALTNF